MRSDHRGRRGRNHQRSGERDAEHWRAARHSAGRHGECAGARDTDRRADGSRSGAAGAVVPRRVSTGRLQLSSGAPRSFLCMAGAGLDAEIVSRLNLDLKAAAGKLAYYVAGFSHVFRPLREFEVLVDGRGFEASFALISRVRNYGGDLEIARGASLLSDDFEVVLFRGTASLRYLRYLLGVALGRAHRMSGC